MSSTDTNQTPYKTLVLLGALYLCSPSWQGFIKDMAKRLKMEGPEGFSDEQLNQELARYNATLGDSSVSFYCEKRYLLFEIKYGGTKP